MTILVRLDGMVNWRGERRKKLYRAVLRRGRWTETGGSYRPWRRERMEFRYSERDPACTKPSGCCWD